MWKKFKASIFVRLAVIRFLLEGAIEIGLAVMITVSMFDKTRNFSNNFFTVSCLFARGKYTRTGK